MAETTSRPRPSRGAAGVPMRSRSGLRRGAFLVAAYVGLSAGVIVALVLFPLPAGAQSTLPACVVGQTYSHPGPAAVGGCFVGYGTSASVTVSVPSSNVSTRVALALVIPAGVTEEEVCAELVRSGGTLRGCPGDVTEPGVPRVHPDTGATSTQLVMSAPLGSYFELQLTGTTNNTATVEAFSADGIGDPTSTSTTSSTTTTTEPPSSTTTSTTEPPEPGATELGVPAWEAAACSWELGGVVEATPRACLDPSTVSGHGSTTYRDGVIVLVLIVNTLLTGGLLVQAARR